MNTSVITDIMIGVGTDLMIYIDGIDYRLRSVLIGIKKNDYLILDCPKMTGIETKLFDGNKINIVFLYEGVVYGCRSAIINFIRNPTRLIFASYPYKIEKMELRASKRIACYIPSTFQLEEDPTVFNGVIVDISKGGCRLVTNSDDSIDVSTFKVSGRVHMTLQLIGTDNTVNLAGEIQSLSLDRRKVSVGLRFAELDNNVMNKLDEYIQNVVDFL